MSRPMKVRLERDRGVDVIRLAVGGSQVELQAFDVEQVIEQLSFFRAAMQPAVPEQVSSTDRFVVEMDPCWYVEPHPLVDGLALFLRHTGYGWAGFVFSDERLDELRHELSEYESNVETRFELPN